MKEYKLSSNEFDDIDIKNIVKLFNGGYLTMGKHVREFEERFAESHGRKYAVMTNSGSSANLLMIASLVESGRLKRGDTVAVSSVSWSTTYFPISQYGLKIQFIDVSLETFCLDPNAIKQLFADSKPAALLHVPLLGYYETAYDLKELCEANDVLYLEDCCEAFGSSFNGIVAGSLGGWSTFSFFYSHQLPAIEGGMLCTDSKVLYDHALSLRAHGWTRDITGQSTLEIEPDPFLRAFRFVLPGYCVRPMEINAVLANRRLDLWEQVFALRKANHDFFCKEISSITNIKPQRAHIGMSAFGFGILAPTGEARKLIVKKLVEHGVEVRPIVAGNFVNNPVVERINHSVFGRLDNSDIIDSCGFFIGNHAKCLKSEIESAFELIKEVLNG